MEVSRIFHNVGQGAFYSEEFLFDNNKRFVIVYDCGSSTLNNTQLKTRINSDFDGNTDIDILFISHFHSDHINGCKHLNPKVVIIPFFTKEQIAILSIINKVGDEDFQIEMLEHPEIYFKNSKIVRVSPHKKNKYEYSENDFSVPIEELVSNINNKFSDQNSGISIRLTDNKLQSFWEFVPYNPCWNKYFNSFKNEVKIHGLDFGTLTNDKNGEYVRTHFLELKNIYSKLKNINDHSLQLYSGPINDSKITTIQSLLSRRFCPCWFYVEFSSGCLYFGDIKIEDDWKNDYYKFLCDTHRLSKIGTVQIPHHGSKDNNGEKCLEDLNKPCICVISAGENNKYGHPSSNLIAKLHNSDALVSIVTENISTMLIESNIQ